MGNTYGTVQLQELEPWTSDHHSVETPPKRLVYVYYCEICNSILILSDKLDYRPSFLYSVSDECPTCHFKLESSLRCHAVNLRIPAELFTKTLAKRHTLSRQLNHLSTTTPPSRLMPKLESLLNSKATPISPLEEISPPKSPALSFGEDFLDRLCGGVYTEQLTVLYGDRVCKTIAERLCVRSQLPLKKGGFDAASVFIDGGNSFDLYQISNYAFKLQLDCDETLRRIKVSRAFTCYQLVNLIVEKLPKLLCQEEIRLVVIGNLLDMFLDPEIEANETQQTVNFLSAFLARFVRDNNVALVVTCPVGKARDGLLRQFLTSRAQVVLKAERMSGRKSRFVLKKHPTKPISQ